MLNYIRVTRLSKNCSRQFQGLRPSQFFFKFVGRKTRCYRADIIIITIIIVLYGAEDLLFRFISIFFSSSPRNCIRYTRANRHKTATAAAARERIKMQECARSQVLRAYYFPFVWTVVLRPAYYIIHYCIYERTGVLTNVLYYCMVYYIYLYYAYR